MNKSKVMPLATILVVVMMVSVTIPLNSNSLDADSQIVVTDGVGREHRFDKLPSKIVTLGTGMTATAIEIGLIDSIIVCDKYSYQYDDEIFDIVRDKVDSGDIRANGTLWGEGVTSVKNDIWKMTEDLQLSDDNVVDDVAIFVTGIPSTLDPLYEDLTYGRYNYKHVLCWNDVTSYDALIDMVSTMSLVMKGYDDPQVEQMKEIVNLISLRLSGYPESMRREAFFVTYHAGELKVGNEGSLANSMILAAGGDSITMDPSKGSTYATSIQRILERYGTDVVIFVDDLVVSDQSKLDMLRKTLGGNDVTLVALDPLWNNYCVESMDGIWAMACAMYPDLFEGDVPVIPSDYDENVILYVTAGIIGSMVIAAVAFLYFRPELMKRER